MKGVSILTEFGLKFGFGGKWASYSLSRNSLSLDGLFLSLKLILLIACIRMCVCVCPIAEMWGRGIYSNLRCEHLNASEENSLGFSSLSARLEYSVGEQIEGEEIGQ